jgi:hypothetical protein
MLVLATALATRVSWEEPFTVVPASRLGATSAWAQQLHGVLHTPGRHGHASSIVATEQAGDVAVHTAQARDGLSVTSVIAAPEVPAADVLAVAYQVATSDGGTQRSLFDLPLGEGPQWTLTEHPIPTSTRDGRRERLAAILPAWSMQGVHLGHPDLGFPAAAAALDDLLGGAAPLYGARQSVIARYTRVGFEAAAVTAIKWRARGPAGTTACDASPIEAARGTVAATIDEIVAARDRVLSTNLADRRWLATEFAPWLADADGAPLPGEFGAWMDELAGIASMARAMARLLLLVAARAESDVTHAVTFADELPVRSRMVLAAAPGEVPAEDGLEGYLALSPGAFLPTDVPAADVPAALEKAVEALAAGDGDRAREWAVRAVAAQEAGALQFLADLDFRAGRRDEAMAWLLEASCQGDPTAARGVGQRLEHEFPKGGVALARRRRGPRRRRGLLDCGAAGTARRPGRAGTRVGGAWCRGRRPPMHARARPGHGRT